jgi:stage III sporulation protein AE
VLPLIALTCIFNVVSHFSPSIKLTKFSDFFTGIIKWILGLTILVFGFFVSIQGITSAHFDGISIRAAKFAISNSIPIVGGFLKDGFDLVVAGSVLIKNTIGVSVLLLLFLMIIKPLLSLGVFSILLKFTAAIIEPISEPKISDLCISVSKTITYLTSVLLIVGMMLFVMVLLMIFSANAFV